MSRNRGSSQLGAPYPCQPGTWGTLEAMRVMLSPPLHLTKYYKLETKLGSWSFRGLAPRQVEALLQQCGCSAEFVSRIFAESKVSYALQGTEIQPTPELTLLLDETARSQLYSWLANDSEVSAQFAAFRYFGESLDRWLENSHLQVSTIELVRPYVYRHGHLLKFADLGSILDKIDDDREAALLMKALSREITLRVRLNISSHDDIDQLAAYWGRGFREHDVRPILESFAHFESDHFFDIVHLLPPLPRKLLYTYPRAPANKVQFKQTCYWTALNFFNEEPDPRWHDLNQVNRAILTEWEPISSQPMLGDIGLFMDGNENAYHAAVFIADDILFSKNGPSVVRPWMLCHENYLRHFYHREQPLHVRYYRRRGM